MEGTDLTVIDRLRTLGIPRDSLTAIRSRGARLLPLGPADAIKQFLLLAFFYVAYALARAVPGGQDVKARVNGDAVMGAERALHVYIEPWVQAKLSHWDALLSFFNLYYVYCHLTVVFVCLVWLYARNPSTYSLYRNWLMTINGVALVFYMLLPTAPPRLIHTSGIVDTLWLLSPVNFQRGLLAETANVYAAIPSLHFCWAMFVGMAIFMSTRNRVARSFAVFHPSMMLLTIVVTGNHWLFDAAAGALVVLGAHALAVRGGRARVVEMPMAVQRGGSVR